MKTRITIAAIALLACFGTAAAQSPQQQLEFAEQLREDGDNVLALLEYRRFAHFHPDHRKAPNALMQAARIRLLHTGEVGKAERTLDRISKQYPRTDVGEKAGRLQDFVDENSDHQGRPLARYLRAQKAAEQGKRDRALELFNSIPEKWQDARVADDAMLAAAKLHLKAGDEPRKARQTLNHLLDNYPDRSTAPEAMYRRAEAIVQMRGRSDPARSAYRKVRQQFPDSPYAKRASRRLRELEENRSFVERTYDKDQVRDYEVVSSGYEDDRHVEKIELAASPKPELVRATLEDALIKAIDKRRDDSDPVTVEAYYTFPVTEAGKATWRPGQDPTYEVEERRTEDRLKDTLFDLLRDR